MNLVLADAEEFRLTNKSKYAIKDAKRQGTLNTSDLVKEDKRALGLIILRGVNVMGVTIESAPPVNKAARLGLGGRGGSGAVGNKAGGAAGGIMKPLKKNNNNTNSSNQFLASVLRAPIRTVKGFGDAPRAFQPPPGFRKNGGQ